MNYSFKVGTTISIENVNFLIRRMLSEGRVQLESDADGTLTNTTLNELLGKYEQKLLIFVDTSENQKTKKITGRALSTFSDAVQQKAIRKKKYVEFVTGCGRFISTPEKLQPHIKACAEKLNDANPPSCTSVYRWYRAIITNQGDYRALIDRFDKRGGSGSRLCPEIQTLLQQSIERIYMTQLREPASEVYFDLLHKVNKENEFRSSSEKLKMPSRATIYRAIANLDKFETTCARYSPRIAKMKFRSSGNGPNPTRIMERVEIDHTPLDLFVFDRETNLPLGRPTVTLAIDVFSKMPVGIHIGFQGTSIESVFACLRNAIMPKTYLRDKFKTVESDWPCYGIIENLVCDNGSEFRSMELERVALEMGTHLIFCPKRQPYYKGTIERFLKTVNFSFSRMLPGSSFARWFHREDYDPLKDAIVEFDQLVQYLHKWMLDIYAQTIHRGIRAIPYIKWNEGMSAYPPALLKNPEHLDIALGRTSQRVLGSYGIDLNNIRYNDSALDVIRKRYGPRVQVDVRHYFGDLSYVHVIDPATQSAILVPALDQDYTRDLNLVQHDLLSKHVREKNSGQVNINALAKAKADLREIVYEMASSKSQRTRQKSGKLRGIGTNQKDIMGSDATAIGEIKESSERFSSSIGSEDLPSIGSINMHVLGKKRK